ncbi:MAG TPA: lysophospholipid acyltransferase family protein [Mycobacteriales bacterium]
MNSDARVERARVNRVGWFYWVMKVALTPVMTAYFRPTIEGARYVPARGGAILASNHTSYFDWLFLPLVVRWRRLSFLAKGEYFTRPGLSGLGQRFFFSATGQVPVVRGGGRRGDAALNTAAELIEEGRLLAIFPEGTRTLDGRLQPGKTGVVRMAGRTGAPVIPCGIVGAFEVAPKGARVPRPQKVTVRFGPPMSWSGQRFDIDDGVLLRKYTDDLMAAIQDLSGQEWARQDPQETAPPTD